MKKVFSITISIIILMSVFAAFTSKDTSEASDTVSAKTGVGVISTVTTNSKNAVSQKGLVQTETTVVGVLVDDKGVIKDCVIDMAYASIQFTNKGVIVKDTYDTCSSKADLGTKYGMGANSKIGKEWNEQVAALSDYVVGKTLDEVEGIAINSGSGKSTEPDLMNSVTFRIADIHKAIIEAVNNAKNIGANSHDKLSLGINTFVGSGTKNAGKKNGVAQTLYDIAIVSYDEDNKVTSSIIDEVKSDVLFNKKGVITSKLGTEIKTKLDNASVNKDWCDQTKALSDYMIGKTTDEISKVVVGGYVSEADLKSKVKLQIKNIMKAIVKAGSYIK